MSTSQRIQTLNYELVGFKLFQVDQGSINAHYIGIPMFQKPISKVNNITNVIIIVLINLYFLNVWFFFIWFYKIVDEANYVFS